MKILKSFVLILVASLMIVGCGGEEKKEEEKNTIKIKTKSENEPKADENVANLLITGDDLMQYNKKELRVKEGQKVRLTLRHIGKMEKNIMGHNVVILKQGVEAAEFAARAATERDNDYIPADAADQIVAHTAMIGGGQTTTVEFDAPPAGEYDFLCSFPAHYALMNGKFIVEKAE